MRSPRAVNRRHVRCTPIHANHGKGQRTQAQRLAQKAIRQSLINQDPYSAKASEVFGQLDLKLAEFSKKAELSEEERLEKERRAALKKADKDAQVRAKKEAELRRKQEKLERKQAEAAAKGEASDPKLDAITYVPPTLVAEESKPIKKNDSKKNKKSEKKAEEKPIVKIEEPPVVVVEQKNEEKSDKKSKKENKKDKKKSESEPQSGVDEVKLFDATATPKNTPIDTPKEAPNTPAEYDLEPPHHQHHVDIQQAVEEKSKSRKSKKDKKQSESKTEPEEIKYSTPEVPQEEPVIEKVEHVKQETLPGLNGHHEEGKKSKKDKKGKEKHQSESHEEVKIESVKPIDRVEEPVSIQIEEKDSSKKDKKKNKKEKRTSESQFSPDSGVVIEQHIDVEPETAKTTATVTKTQEEIKPEPTKESKNKKKDKKHKKSESEAHAEPEPVATKENGHIIDSAPIEKPEEAKELKYDEQVLTVDSKSKDKKDSKKKNKKGKTNSESESPKEKEKSPVKESAKTLEEIVIPESTKADPQASPSPTNGSSKRDKKKKGKGKENGSPTTVVEEKPSPVGSGRFNPVEEASYQHYEELASHGKKETTHQGHNGHLADEHGFEEQKGKKGRKKNKSRSSESHELNGKLDGAEVITELSYDRDDLNKLAAESTSGQPSPVSPVQVNEVTSTETEEGGQRVYRENIKAAYDVDPSIDPNAHPTQFAIQVQKLVESTLAASELKHADPNTKLSVQAQLLRLKEHDDKPKHTYTIRPLTPLAFERHVTVLTPTPRERSYKLLPKDVLFCSYMIDSYGEDYEGMTKDAKNVYRENARSLQRKMRVFKESPHFETYKKAKETGRTVEEVLQEEAAAHA